jgi:transposase InsO family protein
MTITKDVGLCLVYGDMLDEMMEYLDMVRETDATNMYGAGPWLSNAYGLSKQDARAVLQHWMDTYNERRQAQRLGA